MILCYHDIKEALQWGIWRAYRNGTQVFPSDLQINPNSVDVTLGNILLEPIRYGDEPVDPRDEEENLLWKRHQFDEFRLNPGAFFLAHVQERFDCSEPLMIGGEMRRFIPMIEGRSTLARCGLCVHQTAGFGDLGFSANFTLELTSHLPILLRPGNRIAQVYFVEASGGGKSYNGAYTDQFDAPRAPVLGKGRV